MSLNYQRNSHSLFTGYHIIQYRKMAELIIIRGRSESSADSGIILLWLLWMCILWSLGYQRV